MLFLETLELWLFSFKHSILLDCRSVLVLANGMKASRLPGYIQPAIDFLSIFLGSFFSFYVDKEAMCCG